MSLKERVFSQHYNIFRKIISYYKKIWRKNKTKKYKKIRKVNTLKENISSLFFPLFLVIMISFYAKQNKLTKFQISHRFTLFHFGEVWERNFSYSLIIFRKKKEERTRKVAPFQVKDIALRKYLLLQILLKIFQFLKRIKVLVAE